MSELDESMQLRVAEHVEAAYGALDGLEPVFGQAVAALGDALLAERRVVVCGFGAGASLAQIFAANLLGRTRIERPGLPVIVIGGDATVLGTIIDDFGLASALARPLRTLLQPADAVLLVCGNPPPITNAAIQAAHACDARVIALAGTGTDAGAFAPEDLVLRIPSDDPARIVECQLLLLNCLAEFLELRLFGGN